MFQLNYSFEKYTPKGRNIWEKIQIFMKRAVFEDSAVVLRLHYCWFCFVVGVYWAWSGRWSLRRLFRLFLAFGVSISDPDSNLCRCGISLNMWNVTDLKIANVSGVFFLKYSLKKMLLNSVFTCHSPSRSLWLNNKPLETGVLMENAI